MIFEPFPKIARLSRECVVTEKIDGTNASIKIDLAAGVFLIGSRTRWITPEADNAGFARWAMTHREELLALGDGHHFGEWWGSGIQRGYGLANGDKRFSLFNTARWSDASDRPACCSVVPLLYLGEFDTGVIVNCVERLRVGGSLAAPGFFRPEGVIVWHEAARISFKKTIEKDAEWKGLGQ